MPHDEDSDWSVALQDSDWSMPHDDDSNGEEEGEDRSRPDGTDDDEEGDDRSMAGPEGILSSYDSAEVSYYCCAVYVKEFYKKREHFQNFHFNISTTIA